MKRIIACGGLLALLLVLMLLAWQGVDVSAAPLAAPTPVAVQSIPWTGATPVFHAASSDGNTFPNDGFTVVYIKNGSGAEIEATFITPITLNGLAVADLVTTIITGTERIVGPFKPETFNDTESKLTVTWDVTSSVTFAVLRW